MKLDLSSNAIGYEGTQILASALKGSLVSAWLSNLFSDFFYDFNNRNCKHLILVLIILEIEGQNMWQICWNMEP